MHKTLRSLLLGLLAIAFAVVPVLAQQQQPNLDKYAGVYEFEAPDYGVISVIITVTENKAGLTLTAMNAPAQNLTYISNNLYQLNSADFGLIDIGFVEEEDGSISAITIDSADFSFVAMKKKQ